MVEHRLAAELDRQLRIDFDLVEAQLDADASGAIRWMVRANALEGNGVLYKTVAGKRSSLPVLSGSGPRRTASLCSMIFHAVTNSLNDS